MKKKIILALAAAILLIVVYLVYWQASKSGKSTEFNWDNPDWVFNIKIPDNFDAAHLERLGEKIIASKQLYTEKKNETWTWITIGNMYEFARDYDRAIGAYQRVAALNESEYISRMNLAYIYENQKNDYVKAEEYYKKVMELSDTNPGHYINLARLYELKMNKLDEAEKVYTTGLEKTNNNSDLLIAAIYFYQRTNNAEKVAEYSSKLLKLYPDNANYKSDFGSLVN